MQTDDKMGASVHMLNADNSTLNCCYNVTSSTRSLVNHHLNPDVQTTEEDAAAEGLACCHSWTSLLLLVFVAAGVTGNTLVCCAVAVERKLRNVTSYFLVSLAVADLLVSLVVMPSCIAHDVIGKQFLFIFVDVSRHSSLIVYEACN